MCCMSVLFLVLLCSVVVDTITKAIQHSNKFFTTARLLIVIPICKCLTGLCLQDVVAANTTSSEMDFILYVLAAVNS